MVIVHDTQGGREPNRFSINGNRVNQILYELELVGTRTSLDELDADI